MKYIILLIIICLALTGCTLFPEPVEITIEPEPVISIRIEPEYSDIKLRDSVELFCLDQLDRPVIASWSKNCGAGTLSVLIGKSCIYTTPNYNEGYQIIWAEYEGLKTEARVNGVKERM